MALSRSLLLPIGLTTFLLAVDAAVSLGLVSSMVAFLHHYGRGPCPVANPTGSYFLLAGEPANLVTNQGHTTNAAGGTALVLVAFGGMIALWLEKRSRKKRDSSSPVFYLWALIVFFSFLLTLVALIYTFVETSKTGGQSIDLAVAETNPAPVKYPDHRWTPENWYAAVLELPLVSDNNRRIISGNLTIMRAWRWNIIPLFVLGFVLLVLVALEVLRVRRRNTQRIEVVDVPAWPLK
ncbi:uncharacterized protein B0T15DRAFT_234411 [Chaetomium strumarium]|uniref:Uncharacterized protein n=1 Tax=Chaetomium strumarium TaxID=1170767 RepID=A0AAJ0GQG4_9PEZI|nr:hypothetical protein B0T15DRAFT_234411 [Chaetomium strumarium]